MSPLRPLLAAPRGGRGFTLIELIMVLIILGILAVLVLPRASLTQGFDEVGFHNAVRATLEFARKSAVAQRRHVQVTLTGNNLILLIANDSPEGANALSFAGPMGVRSPCRHLIATARGARSTSFVHRPMPPTPWAAPAPWSSAPWADPMPQPSTP